MTARELTAALGGQWHGGYGMVRCPTHNDRRPSLTIRDGDTAPLLRCKAGCDCRDIITALKALNLWLSFREEQIPWQPPARKSAVPASTSNRERAAAIWRETRPAPATLTDGWLEHRGIRFAIPSTIRHHDGLDYHDAGKVLGRWPAMVVRLDDPAGAFCGIQRLWLDGGTHKASVPAPRKTLGQTGVAWFGGRNVPAIVAGEGVETVLSAREHTGGVHLPPWGCCREPDGGPHALPGAPPEPYGCTAVAAICAAGLAKFDPPATVRRLFICEDDDAAGRKTTLACAERAAARGITVTILREAVR